MILTFHSLDSDSNKVFFKSEYEIIDGKYIFDDKSVKNTRIIMKINDDNTIIFKRIGDINMEMLLDVNNNTLCKYKNEMGLEFELIISTNSVKITGKKVEIDYDSKIYDVISNHKIWILFN